MLTPGRDGVDDKERPVPWREGGWLADIPPWWSLGKASSCVGGDYDAVCAHSHSPLLPVLERLLRGCSWLGALGRAFGILFSANCTMNFLMYFKQLILKWCEQVFL